MHTLRIASAVRKRCRKKETCFSVFRVMDELEGVTKRSILFVQKKKKFVQKKEVNFIGAKREVLFKRNFSSYFLIP